MDKDIHQRIKEAREAAGLTKVELADRLGLSPQSVWGWEKNAMPRRENLPKIARTLNVSEQWLAFGTTGGVPCGKGMRMTLVPVLEKILAGGRERPIDIVSLAAVQLNEGWLRRNFGRDDAADFRLLPVRGDSMEPTFSLGDTVLVDTSIKEITSDGLYAAYLDGNTFAKRFQRLSGGNLLMISDNPRYQPVTIQPDADFKVIGRIVYRWHGNVC